MPMLRSLGRWLFVACLSLCSTGCITKILTDGNIDATRRSALRFDTIDDYELARAASQGAFGQFEALHSLAPYNTDALFLLVKAWTGYGSIFLQDDIERAQDADDEAGEMRARHRAHLAYNRAIYYGVEHLGQRADGFQDAKKDVRTFKTWLTRNFATEDDAAVLLWTGFAWLQRVGVVAKVDDVLGPELVAELWVGEEMVARSVEISPTRDYFLGQLVLAGYHSRSALSEPEQSRKMFEAALQQSRGQVLGIKFAYAITYACLKGDAKLYGDLLHQVLAFDDDQVTARAPNAIAKHRAETWMNPKRAKTACGIDLAPTGEQTTVNPAPEQAL